MARDVLVPEPAAAVRLPRPRRGPRPTPGWSPGPADRRPSIELEYDDLRLLSLLSSGMTLSAVGRELGVCDRTVRRRLRSLCDQLGVLTPIQAVTWAARYWLI